MNAFTRRNFLKTTAIGAVTSTNSLCRGQDESDPDSTVHVGLIVHQSIKYDSVILGLVEIPGVRVRAISALNQREANYGAGILKRAGNANVSLYSDYRKMLAEEAKLDAVIVMSPEWRRVSECVDCLEAGKHVYVLPPIGRDLGAIKKLAQQARGQDKLIQVGYHRRSLPHYRMVKERFIDARGILDPIANANVAWRFSSQIDSGVSVPKKKAQHLDQEVLEANGYDSMKTYLNWRHHRRFSIGVLGGLPAHFIDTILWLFKDNPHTITATGRNLHARGRDTLTQFHITLEFGQGEDYRVANIQLLDDPSVWLSSEVFVGEGMSLLLSDQANSQNFFVEHRFGEANDWRNIAKAEGLSLRSPANDVRLPQAAAAISSFTRPTGFYHLPLGEQRHLEQPHLADFISAIREGTPLRCPLAEGYRAEVVLHKILEAVETKASVTLTPSDFDLSLI